MTDEKQDENNSGVEGFLKRQEEVDEELRKLGWEIPEKANDKENEEH